MGQNELGKIFRKRNLKNIKGKGGRQQAAASLLARWPKPAQPARVSPPPRASTASARADGRASTPWHASSVLSPRGAHAPGWTHPGRPPGAPDRACLLPRCLTRSSTRSLALSLACAQ